MINEREVSKLNHMAFHMTLKPGTGPDYDRLHRDLPASLFEQLESATIVEYRIFRDDVHVFAFIRYEDEERFNRALSNDPPDPEFAAWAKEVRQLFEKIEIDPDTGFQRALPEVFTISGEAWKNKGGTS